jgi:translation initiation factor IF-3
LRRYRCQTQINEKIRAKELRLVGQDGEQIGVKSKQEALENEFSH